MKVIQVVAAGALVLGVALAAGADESRGGGTSTQRDFDAKAAERREQIDAADAKVDAALERVQGEATRARDALSRMNATASRARASD